MKRLLYVLFILNFFGLQAQPYTVGTQNVTWTDAARSNRSVPVEIRYPGTNSAMANDSFPFVVFGHGFQMTGDNYYSISDSLVKRGYIVALAGTETSLSPVHADFGKDFIFIYNKLISESQSNAASFLYHHVVARGAIGGHSMGGGSTVLSCQYGTPATCYFTFAAANTNPSSIAAAPSMNKPYLAFAGSRDCIAPPAAHQLPMYDSSGAPCKVYVNILDALHCQFGSGNFQCNFGEGFSGCATSPLSRTAQINKALSFLYPYLDYYLKQQCAAWTQFEAVYAANTVDALKRNCVNTIPNNPAITGSNTFCTGGSTVLTAAPAGFTYNWSNAATTQTNSVSSAGNYGVTISNGVCAVTATPVAVTESTVPATPSAITMADTVCSGITNIEIVTPVSLPGEYYLWTLPGGWSITSGDSTNVIYALSGTTGGTVSVAIGNSCGVSQAVTTSVVVVPSNLGTPGSVTGADTLCSGAASIFSIAPVSGANSYTWSFPAGWNINSGANTNSISVYTGSAGVVSVSAVNSCGASAAATKTVVVPAQPVAGPISGPDTVCGGQTVEFNVDSIEGADTYLWNYPGTWVPVGQVTNVINITAGAAGQVSMVATGQCGQSLIIVKDVIANTAPVLTGEIIGPDTICQGGGAGTYFALNPLPAGNDIYGWNLPNGWSFLSSDSTAAPVINVGSAGTLTVNAINGCGNSNALTLQVAVVDTPNAQVSVAGNVLTASPTGAGYTYSWFLDGQLIQGADGANYTASASGNYSVVVTNTNFCSSQSQAVNFIYSGIAQLKAYTFSLYPNPVTNNRVWLTTAAELTGGELKIANAEGKTVLSTRVSAMQTEINLSYLPAGVYVVSLQKEGVFLQKKMTLL